ncbi:hypothetical protein ELUMI_v1c05020 [Williamsoniiplasma luminosum]|uniref:Uncharacterized protein n=1 Tax=Williamsoniiplasma luminosum TaxID=214888 RepID=A0A2K8NUK9_9MOLU|nr:hypothetical protein [Williamsoniiplasma luminosum]ATZ17226.1 hypothetical protein ELUMI_v1c05020 [Williamsoniiplasma luminosum]
MNKKFYYTEVSINDLKKSNLFLNVLRDEFNENKFQQTSGNHDEDYLTTPYSLAYSSETNEVVYNVGEWADMDFMDEISSLENNGFEVYQLEFKDFENEILKIRNYNEMEAK